MTCCDATIAIDPAHEKDVHREDLKRAATPIKDGQFQSDFIIPDMHCAACISKLERGFKDVIGVEHVRANLSLKRLSVIWHEGKISPIDIEDHIRKLGFASSPFDLTALTNKQDEVGRKLLISLAIAGFSAMNIMLLSVSVWSGTDLETTKLFHLISGLIATPAVLFAGQPFFTSAFAALKVKRLNMDVPISLAVLLALGMSIYESLTGGTEAYFDAAVSLLFFLLIGRYLDHLMRRRARHAVDQLSNLSAKGALVINESGKAIYRALSEIKPGERIQVKPGDRVPLDSVLLAEKALFDRSLVTGESVPVTLKKGSEVEAGTLNLHQYVELKVLRPEGQSFIAEITKLMEAAEGSRNQYIRIADRMAQIYAPAVHLLAFITFIGWFVTTGDWHISLYTAIAVLIITCPCALGLAVPVVHVIAATRLFNKGIMMKDGSALERAAEIDTIFFDKTGTLTEGSSTAVKIEGDKSLLPLAKTLAQSSSHPKASVVADYLADTPLFEENLIVAEHTGNGVEGQFGAVMVRLGRSDWANEISPNKSHDGLICVDNKGRCLSFDVEEVLRSGVIKTVRGLQKSGFDVALISGDEKSRVDKIAQKAGIETAYANQRPTDKIKEIKRLTEKGSQILMVGDGLNDAAALSEAHASIAPANACDVGRMAADFVFMRDNLDAVPLTLKVAKKAAALVKQNFALALIYNAIAVPCAIAGLVTPLFAALAMSLSSIVVIANSMRLNLERDQRLKNQSAEANEVIHKELNPA